MMGVGWRVIRSVPKVRPESPLTPKGGIGSIKYGNIVEINNWSWEFEDS